MSESLSYFHDVAISLVSLVTVYPEAAEWLRRDGNLTGALEKIRSMVLSSFQSMATCDSDSLDTVRGSLGAAISFLRSADGGGEEEEEEEEEEEMENPWMQSAIST